MFLLTIVPRSFVVSFVLVGLPVLLISVGVDLRRYAHLWRVGNHRTSKRDIDRLCYPTHAADHLLAARFCCLAAFLREEHAVSTLSYVWPIALVVLSNVVYQICSKAIPTDMSPFASLFVTYLVGALASLVAFFVLGRQVTLVEELRKVNWAPFVLGIVIVGLEVGFIYTYRAGWEVSMASIVQSSFLAVALLGVGYALYGEAITPTKAAGIVICLIGLYVINR